MARFAPKLPVASAERERVTISDGDWQSIESAYGQKLSLEARRDIHEKTQEFVDRAEFEQNAEPVSDARDRITTIIGAASSLRSAIDSGVHDADIYACRLIRKHLWKQSEAKKQKEGDAIKRRRRKKRDPLRNISSDMRLLIFRCQDALRELDDTKDQGFSKGEAWKRWIRRLTSIAKAHNLPGGARKDSDKQSGSHASPFVEFVWALQQFVPGTHRRAHSKDALAKAISEARRQNRDAIQLPEVTVPAEEPPAKVEESAGETATAAAGEAPAEKTAETSPAQAEGELSAPSAEEGRPGEARRQKRDE